ncbi:MAG TPA: LysM domain-containing protein, partial [Methylomirabilota bacterium]|nr:LysM domain-containing protein [Methylomirabilota bacterium]
MRPGVRRNARCLGLVALVALSSARVAAADPPPSATRAPERVHQVARGDTLSGIATRYGVTVAALVTVNRLASSGSALRVGQRLTIPPAQAKGAAGRAQPRRVAATSRGP